MEIIKEYCRELLFKLLSKQQNEFAKSKSCTTNLLETLDFISSSLDKGCPVDVILLDFAKAFDTVPHKKLGFLWNLWLNS